MLVTLVLLLLHYTQTFLKFYQAFELLIYRFSNSKKFTTAAVGCQVDSLFHAMKSIFKMSKMYTKKKAHIYKYLICLRVQNRSISLR